MQGAQLNEATDTLEVPNDSVPPSPASDQEEDEPPIPADQIEPLVRQVTEDYANASLLLRLPGCIPIPAFDTDVPMPAEKWTNLEAHSFRDNIMDLLGRDTATIPACTCETSSATNRTNGQGRRQRRRKVVETPLIARPVAEDVYTTRKRQDILSSLCVPAHQRDANTTKILVVSFGGQSIPKPSSSRPMTPIPGSRNGSISLENELPLERLNGLIGVKGLKGVEHIGLNLKEVTIAANGHQGSPFHHQNIHQDTVTPEPASSVTKSAVQDGASSQKVSSALARTRSAAPRLQRLMTQDHIYLPGAPPALHRPGQISGPAQPGVRHRRKISLEVPKAYQTEGQQDSTVEEQIQLSIVEASLEEALPANASVAEQQEDEEQLIPKGWIAIVCGLSVKDGADELPENFYAAPRDVYVPDLTAICDVLLGKLGYGTCSETVSSQTPFVYGE
jgi:hypothetical protein